ncbi:MAG: TadE/TadG family type IV pilus assembly protein [Paracoccaceae bacterium]|nr:TadE/TadG family type IV pilus assembly protein [Paracoccaceae bacterium]
MKTLRRILNRFRRREDGAATVEFVILFMPFMLLLVSTYEIGMANVRHVMLERGTDLAVRQIRLNTGAAPTKEQIRTMVCNAAGIIPDCVNVLEVELQSVDKATWSMPPREAKCVDRTEPIQPVVKYENGLQNEMMMIRFCAVVDPMFPSFGLGYTMPKDESGGYRLVSVTAFVNEPT